MKLFGIATSSRILKVIELRETRVVASPDELRGVAKFLLHVAEQIDIHGEKFNHDHLVDFDREGPQRPDVVVYRE